MYVLNFLLRKKDELKIVFAIRMQGFRVCLTHSKCFINCKKRHLKFTILDDICYFLLVLDCVELNL